MNDFVYSEGIKFFEMFFGTSGQVRRRTKTKRIKTKQEKDHLKVFQKEALLTSSY